MFPKQLGYRLVADSNTVPGKQLRGQRVRAFARIWKRGFWMAPRNGIDKPLNGRPNLGILIPALRRTLTTSPGFAPARLS